MASLTRQRANWEDQAPTDLHVEYYSKRADAGLIMSEASPINPGGGTFPGSCGIYS